MTRSYHRWLEKCDNHHCCSTGPLNLGSQGTPLYSVDGAVFVEVLSDGTFSIFDTETGATIYVIYGATADTIQPFSVTMRAVRSTCKDIRARRHPITVAARRRSHSSTLWLDAAP